MVNTRRRLYLLLSMLLVVLSTAGIVGAEEAVEALRVDATSNKRINISYKQIRLDRLVEDLNRLSPGPNLKVKAQSLADEQDLLATRISLDLSGVTWDMAINYIADRLKLVVDRSKVSEGVIYLEKVPRFTDTFDGVRLGEAIKEIASRGNANIIFTPSVRIDQPVYLSFTDVPWREALESLLKANGCTILMDYDGRVMRISTIAEADIQFETRSRQLRYIQPDGPHFQPELVKGDEHEFVKRRGGSGVVNVGMSLTDVLKNIKSEKGTISYESRTNTLILRDTPVKIQEMLAIVDTLDQPPQQVLIESRLLTVEDNPTQRLGVRWGGGSGSTYTGVNGQVVDSRNYWNSSFPFGPDGVGDRTNWSVSPQTNAIVQTGTLSLPDLQATLQMAKTDEKIKITQAPQILVLDNEEASVYIGNVRTYMKAESKQNETSTTVTFTEKDILVGVQLMVIPHVCRGSDEIILEVVPKEVGEPIMSTIEGVGIRMEYPSQKKVKTVHTKMMLRSTETGVIAGLFREEDSQRTDSVPGLSKIPVVGNLFKHKTKEKINTNTMILVTPTIVSPGHDDIFKKDVEAFRDSLASAHN